MKVAVVGSRLFPDRGQVENYIRDLPDGTTIVTGGARGTDTFAAKAATERGLPVMIFRPAYEEHGLRAPLVRNLLIAEQCDRMVAFHDNVSKGTMHVVSLARKLGRPVEVFTARRPLDSIG